MLMPLQHYTNTGVHKSANNSPISSTGLAAVLGVGDWKRDNESEWA
jgi:hypothetical protein